MRQLNPYIDHTVLKAVTSRAAVETLCAEADRYGFASVCVNPVHVSLAAEKLKQSRAVVCAVIGFPLGANTTEIKAAETRKAVQDGAAEVDMVINIGAAKEHDYGSVRNDIAAVVDAAGPEVIVKVIIETCYLTKEEIGEVSKCCVDAGADYVKTSTGFGTGGALTEDVTLIKETVAGKALIKASGGIRTMDDAQRLIEAGADRIGVSCGVTLVSE